MPTILTQIFLETFAATDLSRDSFQMTEENKDLSGSFLNSLAFGLLLFTIFYNILFVTVIKPAVDGPDSIPEIDLTLETLQAAPLQQLLSIPRVSKWSVKLHCIEAERLKQLYISCFKIVLSWFSLFNDVNLRRVKLVYINLSAVPQYISNLLKLHFLLQCYSSILCIYMLCFDRYKSVVSRPIIFTLGVYIARTTIQLKDRFFYDFTRTTQRINNGFSYAF